MSKNGVISSIHNISNFRDNLILAITVGFQRFFSQGQLKAFYNHYYPGRPLSFNGAISTSWEAYKGSCQLGARPLIVLTISFTVYSQVPNYAWVGWSTNMTVQRAGIEPGTNRSPVRRLTTAPYSLANDKNEVLNNTFSNQKRYKLYRPRNNTRKSFPKNQGFHE